MTKPRVREMSTSHARAPQIFLFIIALIGAGYLLLPDENEDPPYGESYMREYVAQNPGIPSLLPARLPEGVRFLGHESTRFENRKAVLRSTLFRGARAAAPVQTMCVEFRDSSSGCLVEGDRRKTLHRDQGSLRVTVTFGNSGEVPEDLVDFWESVPLSTNLNDIAWLT
ncbi:hypothetical protein N7925_08880 [Streptomyces sp. CA-278952]|uniref:hypothetical protein n=1 Tax=Streptomyces sp. CA-278952 TaxID=2980556 RepID=UPI002367498F|nr:hypothetical protein [Streptomyces sp. CA-278952]WDG28442.1 hypothetical protein N7925_08880 [Streptomyces sp. CA-278952]